MLVLGICEMALYGMIVIPPHFILCSLSSLT